LKSDRHIRLTVRTTSSEGVRQSQAPIAAALSASGICNHIGIYPWSLLLSKAGDPYEYRAIPSLPRTIPDSSNGRIMVHAFIEWVMGVEVWNLLNG
jgi:hypothetical protein